MSKHTDMVHQPTSVLLIVAFVVGVGIALVTGGLLVLVYILNHGVNPAWIIFLLSSLPPWEVPLPSN